MKLGNIDLEEHQAALIYKELVSKRQSYLDRAREASGLTIPQLYPPEGSDGDTQYPTPYQSVGARGTNNLANKIILSLFPPNTSFFKLSVNPALLAESGKGEGELQDKMQLLEKIITNEMELSGLRAKLVHLLKGCIIGGGVVLYVPDEGSPETYLLDKFGISRDRQGNILRLVIKDAVAYPSLSEEDQGQLKIDEPDVINGKKLLDMYTVILRDTDGSYVVWQEIEGVKFEKTAGIYEEDKCPYIFVPFVDTGESYGRSYVEDYIGDLKSLEGLRQAILEAAGESARILYLIKPGAAISIKQLRNAQSGDALVGNRDDVQTLQSDKRFDMEITTREAEVLRRDLATVFLLDSAVRRDAERVTAEEIRRVSQELEVSLGGIYSTMAELLQRKLVKVYMARLVKAGKLDSILLNELDLEITTGSAALGRGSDFNILTTFITTLQNIVPPEQTQGLIDVSELAKRLAYSLDINTASLVKTEEQIQQERMMAQQEQLAQQVAPQLIQNQTQK